MATIAVVLLAAVLGVALSCLVAALRKGRNGHVVVVLLMLLLAASTTALAARLHAEAQPIPLRGNVTITDTSGGQFQVYLGEQLMTGNPTVLTWDDLLSGSNLGPGVVWMGPADMANPRADLFGGPGAIFVSGSPGVRNYSVLGGNRGRLSRTACGHRQMVVKRVDGTFDLILLIDFEMVDARNEGRRFFLVVRPRSTQPGVYANPRVQMSSSVSGGTDRLNVQVIIGPGGPSVTIPEEVKEKGLWTPGSGGSN